MSNSVVDDSLVGLEPDIDAFVRALLDRAAAIRVPELFAHRRTDEVPARAVPDGAPTRPALDLRGAVGARAPGERVGGRCAHLARPLMGSPDAESIKLIYKLTGTPLPDDPRDVDPDLTPFGMKCCIPVVPYRGEYARRTAAITRAAAKEFDTNVKLSFFGDGRTLITIHFRSDDAAQVARAEACERALWDRLTAEGFPPYRASIEQMDRLAAEDPVTFRLVGQLKTSLDPNGIISPGRYV